MIKAREKHINERKREKRIKGGSTSSINHDSCRRPGTHPMTLVHKLTSTFMKWPVWYAIFPSWSQGGLENSPGKSWAQGNIEVHITQVE